MTTIYLMHPKHGVKVATMEAEAQYDELNGWRRFALEDLQNDDALEPDAILPDDEVEANVMAEAPRRRGRPRKDE
jgi:hypothetical protein